MPATECPRISKAFLEEERAALGGRAFRREYMTEFEDGGAGVFDPRLIERALDGDLKPISFQGNW